jgi:hypothetical protein
VHEHEEWVERARRTSDIVEYIGAPTTEERKFPILAVRTDLGLKHAGEQLRRVSLIALLGSFTYSCRGYEK